MRLVRVEIRFEMECEFPIHLRLGKRSVLSDPILKHRAYGFGCTDLKLPAPSRPPDVAREGNRNGKKGGHEQRNRSEAAIESADSAHHRSCQRGNTRGSTCRRSDLFYFGDLPGYTGPHLVVDGSVGSCIHTMCSVERDYDKPYGGCFARRCYDASSLIGTRPKDRLTVVNYQRSRPAR